MAILISEKSEQGVIFQARLKCTGHPCARFTASAIMLSWSAKTHFLL
jgi:hypothetical protein